LTRRQVPLEGHPVDVLDVPYVTQRPYNMYCFVAAMKMAWDFIRRTRGNGVSADAAPDLSFDAIAALTKVDPYTGVQISKEVLGRFNAEQRLVEAELVFGLDNNGLHLAQSKDLPVIALYYPSMCDNPGTPTSGISHACVFLGATHERVVIHNPWYGPFHQWPANLYDDSRKPLARAAIRFVLRSQATLDVPTTDQEEQ
jgi:hypothetical protein